MPADPRRVKDLFVAALELTDDAARAAFLDRECAGDADLRRRLDALLRAHDEPQPALDRPLAAVAPPEPATVAEEQAGTVLVGRYKLLERIGEGGMGSVWMAQQTEPVKRTVAVKLIKTGGDSKAMLARFEAERQALALMDHPNIAKVLDAGTTDKGQPFFVMELVKGVPITRFCDERKLTPKQRLELFVPVCQAIQHAHQKGIIHRDIKPSNVLIALYDDRPVPKVIDFGVAKATVAPLTEQTLHTGFGALVGTPQYMSPEQATLNNLDIDTRSDIYSLGVLLYELLAGSPPFRQKELEKAGILEILRVIREEEPPRPSTRVSTADGLPSLAADRGTEPAKLTRQLRGEIDWIVMKALDKERSRRYETANGLAMDIQRLLADEPVLAGPPGAAYRLRKFVTRNKGPAVAAGAVLLTMLAGILGTTAGLVRAVKAREAALAAQQAEAERAEGERLAKMHAEKAAEAEHDAKVDAVKAAEAEKQANTKAQEAAEAEKRAREQAQKRLRQIEKQVEMLTTVFDDADPWSPQREGQSLQALWGKRLGEVVKQLDEDAVGDPLAAARLQAHLGKALLQLGHDKQAEVVLTKALRTLETSEGADPAALLDAKNSVASLYHKVGKYAEAERLYKEVLAGRAGRSSDADRSNTFRTKYNLALLYEHHLGNEAEAEVLLREVAEGLSAVLGRTNPHTLLARIALAGVYKRQQNFPRAEALLQEILKVQAGTLPPDHLDILYARAELANVYLAKEEFARAEALLKEVAEGFHDKLGAHHELTYMAKKNLAFAYEGQKKYAEAERLYKEALEAQSAKLSPDHPDTLHTKADLAVLYWKMKKLDHSVPLFEEVLARRKKQLPADHPDTVRALANLGVNYCDDGRIDDGVRCLEEALAAIRKLPAEKQEMLALIPVMAAETYDRAKQYARSEPLHREFLRQSRREFGDDDPRTTGKMAQLAVNLMLQKKHGEAEPVLRDCLAIREKNQPDEWTTFTARSLLGEALLGQKKYADAEPLLKEGYDGLKQRRDKIPEAFRKVRMAEALQRLVQLYEATDNKDEAARWRKQLETLDEIPKQP
jgi:tetratricopeptide (TPR) repeat protein